MTCPGCYYKCGCSIYRALLLYLLLAQHGLWLGVWELVRVPG